MTKMKFILKSTLVLSLLMIASSIAQAQTARTWVSGVGSDGNPCSLTAPCKTLAGAYNKTLAGGQINLLDANSVGSLTISKSVTIDASESFAGLLAVGGFNSIVVNTAATDVVVLRGLAIDGNLKTGLNGVKFIQGGELHVENCTIQNFSGKGITFEPTLANSRLFVKDTIIRNNTGAGISIQPGVNPASAFVSIDHTRLDSNQNGLTAFDKTVVTVSDSVAAGNTSNGFLATASAVAATEINLERCVSTLNGSNGIRAIGGGGNFATIRATNVAVFSNATGLSTGVNGTIFSFGNNRIAGNTAGDGSFTNTGMEL
ncbi:MAG: right-handed parallel beta-helix repeat-containing protein [Pyrinomonadaceae bacterium]